MRKLKILLILLFSITIFLFPQEKPTFYYEKTILKPGVNFEYLLRKLDTDEAVNPSLKAYLISFKADSEISERITISLWIGGILSKYDNMIFKGIPISLKIMEKESGTVYGLLAGGGMDIKIAEYENLNFNLFGKIDYCFGIEKNWDITELAVPGKAKGRSNWGRVCTGPKIVYLISESIKPYAGLVFDHIFGKFNMDETISSLEGSESKKFNSKTSFGILLGGEIEIYEGFELNGGAIIYPAGENLNVFGGLKYSF